MKKFALLILALMGIGFSAKALTVTPASGGTAISADTAANSPASAWTTLGPITMTELRNGHRFHFRQGTNITLGLQAPAGFQFNTAVIPSVTFTAARDITGASASFTSSNLLTITFTVKAEDERDVLTIGGTTGLQVQPVSTSPLASGAIHRPRGTAGGTAVIKGVAPASAPDGIGSGATSFGSLAQVAGTPTQLGILVQPSQNAVVGTAFGRQPVVAIEDAAGNVKTNVNGLIVMAVRGSGEGNLLGTVAVPTVNGIATFTNLAADTVSTITLTFSADGLDPVTSASVVVAPVPQPPVATSLGLRVQPSSLNTAGTVFARQPVAVVLDQYDLPYTNTAGMVVSVARLSGSGELQGTTSVAAVNGVATFSNLSHRVAGDITLQFTSGSLQPVESAQVTVVATTANRLAFETQPGDAMFGLPFGVQPVVITTDTYGNFSTIGVADSVPMQVALLSGTGTLTGTLNQDLGALEDNGVTIFTDLQIDLAGQKQLIASAAGFLSATSAVFTVANTTQSIDFAPLSNKTFGDAAFTVSATASSGLPVSFTIVSGPATISGDVVTITGAGDVVVRASQAGNDNYGPALDVDQGFTVAKANQSITFDALSDKSISDASFSIAASANSGLPVSFSIVSGPATLSNNVVTLTGVGTVRVLASQGGNDNYNAAVDVEQSFAVNKASQTISFDTLADKTFGDGSFSVSASASSGLPVSFAIVSGPATIDGDVITITGAGAVVVRASQAGNETYLAAGDVEQGFSVAKADQTIDFGSLSNKGVNDAPFTVSATASSGLSVSFSIVSGPATISGNEITITGVGTVKVQATQAGNENYHAAPAVEQSFTVGKANQTITFAELSSKTYGDSSFSVSATASSGLPVSFSIVSGPAFLVSSNTIAITGVGAVVVRASQGGNDTFNAAPPVEQGFTVNKASQTISFDSLPAKRYGDAPFQVSATASSGLTVSFSVVSGPATVFGNTVTITGPGAVTIRASQEGNENFSPAPDVDGILNVAPPSDIRVKSDLNGDLKADIFFQNGTRLIVWEMNGLEFERGVAVSKAYKTTDWVAIGQADFNKDGKQDIVWQHADGRLAVWYMNGTQRIGMGSIRPIAAEWRATAVNDMNNDGSPDIVFQNAQGVVVIRYLNGLKVAGNKRVARADAADWKVCGAGDLNLDSSADILVQHTDGRVAIWKGADYKQKESINGGRATAWRVVGIGDLTQDEKYDIVLRSPDNRLAVWTMDGAQKLPGRTVLRDGRRIGTTGVVGPR